MNYSSILLNSDSVISNSNIGLNDNKTPENKINLDNIVKNKNIASNINPNLTFSSNNKVFQINQKSSQKYSNYLIKIKESEYSIKDLITYASSLLDLREFNKCSFILKNYAIPKYPTAMFLYYYSEYFLAQQKKQEEILELSDIGSKYFVSKDLNKLYLTLQSFENCNELSPFMLYLYGVILKELNMGKQAKTMLIKSLNGFPFLWSAWVELCLISKSAELVNIII
jgi:anaphase-promoting complex subunit 8